MSDKIPQHQWTHDGGHVLLVKCVEKGGRGHGGFQWPRSGIVVCPKVSANREDAARITGDAEMDCKSGGLFGWPWGVNLGGGDRGRAGCAGLWHDAVPPGQHRDRFGQRLGQ